MNRQRHSDKQCLLSITKVKEKQRLPKTNASYFTLAFVPPQIDTATIHSQTRAFIVRRNPRYQQQIVDKKIIFAIQFLKENDRN